MCSSTVGRTRTERPLTGPSPCPKSKGDRGDQGYQGAASGDPCWERLIISARSGPRMTDLDDDFHRRHVAGTTMDRPWPCADQTLEQIEHYYRTAPEGSEAVIRETQAGFLRYYLTTIEGRNVRSGLVYLQGHASFNMKSGSMRRQPHGQCKLVLPTEAVRAYAAKHPPQPGLSYSLKLPIGGSARKDEPQ
jgi:hypothetical protein